MKKEEVIKNAYGEHWEIVKNDIDEDGWMNLYFAVRANIGEIGSKTYQFKDIIGNPNKCRILSLCELEENKGWVKLESKIDLPKTEGNYFVILKNNPNKISDLSWHGGSRFLGRQQNEKDWWPENITHYQKILKPELPIY